MELAKVREQLKEIGLTDSEIKVYIACLQLGSSLASRLAEKSGIYRTIIYDILNSLIEKGLVSFFVKENRKYFHAVSPDNLTRYLEEKERRIRDQKEAMLPIIKELKNIEKPKKELYSIEVFSGKEGFKTLLEDIIREGKSYRMVGYEALGTSLLRYYFVHWQKKRIKKKIKRFIIAEKKMKNNISKYKQLTEVKFLPENYHAPTSVLIYGDKVILFLPLEEDFVAVRIESEKIVKSFNTYFDLLWEVAKK